MKHMTHTCRCVLIQIPHDRNILNVMFTENQAEEKSETEYVLSFTETQFYSNAQQDMRILLIVE